MDLNKVNQEQYKSAQGTEIVPDLLATASPISEAVRLYIESKISNNPIKVLELGFGSRLGRYEHIIKRTQRNWEVVLSDFDIAVLPKEKNLPSSNLVKFELMKYNLLEDSIPISNVDVIMATYVFDSIDFPEDNYCAGKHFPGGLISYIKEILPILNTQGMFITIDKFSNDEVNEYDNAGKASFKILDLNDAVRKLKNEKIYCELINLNNFLTNMNQEIPLNLDDHAVLVVNK